MKPKPKLIFLLLALALGGVGLGVVSCHKHDHPQPAPLQQYWCPMHPEVVSDKPGECPQCGGMKLEPKPMSKSPATTKYVCSMHPNIVQDKPGQCPICGMNLTPLKPAVEVIPGRAAVELMPQQEQLIGLRIETAQRQEAFRSIRAPGRVEVIEGRRARLSFRTRGWVEKLHADFTGAWVKQGEPLVDMYSPDLLVAQREYLFALQLAEKPDTQNNPTAQFMAKTLVAAAEEKLKLFELSEAQIEKLAAKRETHPVATLLAPVSGFVESKSLWPKKVINPDEDTIDIVDLSRVWIVASLYEDELPQIKTGFHAHARPVGAPEKIFHGSVQYVYPTLDEKTRTGRVRLEVENENLQLRPQMYAGVEIEVPLGERIVVPTEAVFDQGKRKYLFLSKGGGLYQPREVTLGPRAEVMVEGKPRDVFVVKNGLEAGEAVVVSGNFLLDSESNLRASALGGPPATHSQGTAPKQESSHEHRH